MGKISPILFHGWMNVGLMAAGLLLIAALVYLGVPNA